MLRLELFLPVRCLLAPGQLSAHQNPEVLSAELLCSRSARHVLVPEVILPQVWEQFPSAELCEVPSPVLQHASLPLPGSHCCCLGVSSAHHVIDVKLCWPGYTISDACTLHFTAVKIETGKGCNLPEIKQQKEAELQRDLKSLAHKTWKTQS